MKIFLPFDEPDFPSPQTAEKDGLLAIGGQLNVKWLLSAYQKGIFPWFSEDNPILWWSPNPRAVMKPSEIKIQKSMRSYLNNNKFILKIDTAFKDVIIACSLPRQKQTGTWILPEMTDAYTELHYLGYAHSFEAWKNGKLVGGLYGVSLGKMFFGESMFSFEKNASKFAFIKLCEILQKNNFSLIDCQIQTDHLKSLGCKTIARNKFIKLIAQNNKYQTIKGAWNNFYKIN